MKIHHIAIWTYHLEELREFYVRYFSGKSNEKYVNPRKGFESYFIRFDEGATLELMSRTDVQDVAIEENRLGLTHFAMSFGSREEVLRTTEQLRSDGYTVAGEPRTSGDGYFESVILDPDGNRVECVYKADDDGKPETTIATERLLLRPFRESDLEAIFKCCRNPNLGKNAGWKPHDTLEDSREALHTVFLSQKSVWAIVLKENQQLIGSIGIISDPRRENPAARMLGYWLDEDYWGNGYMTEAVKAVIDYGFGVLKLSLITANCYPHNERSQRVLKRHGFLHEGTLHAAEVTYDGQLYDHQCYYLTNLTL